MRASVIQPFYDYSVKKEGYTTWLYPDVLNLVSSGIGFLLDGGARYGTDTSDAAIQGGTLNPLTMAWFHKGIGWTPTNNVIGTPATEDEVKAAWIKVKTEPSKKYLQGGFAFANDTDLTLSDQAIHDAFEKLQGGFEAELKRYFPNWDDWPADAQFAAMSMAWAMGPAFPRTFTKFASAANALDFTTAAQESFFQGGGGTQAARTGRNADNFAMFNNAANTIIHNGDRELLFFAVAPSPLRGPGGYAPNAGAAQASLPWFPILLVTGGIFGATLAMRHPKRRT